MPTIEPPTDHDLRVELHSVQNSIEHLLDRRSRGEADLDDLDVNLADLRRRERELTAALTPERAGVPRVIRKA